MIVEMRVYQLRPKTVAKFEDMIAAALSGRTKISPLGACWHTEVGELDQVIMMWPYDSHAHREQVLAEVKKARGWPPPVQDLIENVQTKILNPAPFCPPMTDANSATSTKSANTCSAPAAFPKSSSAGRP